MVQPELRRQIDQTMREALRGLNPGDRIPGVSDLALEWHVGSYTVKSVLDRLAQEGLIVRIPGKGTFVSNLERTNPNTVAVIVPSMGQLEARMINTLVEILEEIGQTVLIGLSRGDADRENMIIRRFRGFGADAFVIMPSDGVTYSEELLRLAADRQPTILWDRWLPGLDICCVFGDHHQGTGLAVAELARLGHQNITAVSEVPVHVRQSLQERWEGFCATVREHELEGAPMVWSAESFVPNPMKPATLFVNELTQKIVDHPEVTAYVGLTASDTLGIAKALAVLNLQVPRDKSVIGFGLDNLFDPQTFDDRLAQSGLGGWTWIDQPEEQIARESAKILLAIASQESSDTTRVPIPMCLHRGASSAPPPMADRSVMTTGGRMP